MRKETLFSIVLASTILVVRLGVFLFPLQKLRIDGTVIHHFWFGLLLILFVLCTPKRYAWLRIFVGAFGLGLMADEFVYMILGDGAVSRYWSTASVVGAAAVTAALVALRNKLTTHFL